MRRLSHLSAAMLVGLLGAASSALAQPPPQAGATPACHSRGDLTEMLQQKFSEQPSALGLQADGQLVEVFVAKDGVSWTIVLTRPDGWSCIVAIGQNWESLPEPINGPLA
jgi:hypothetical protein